MPDLSRPWSLLGPIDITAALAWLASGSAAYHATVSPTKPQRAFDLPAAVFDPLYAAILAHFDEPAIVGAAMLSRMLPGQSHPLHVDTQRADWITRVHVPLISNPGAWLLFEGEVYCNVCFGTGENPDDNDAPCAWCQATGRIDAGPDADPVPVHFAVGHAYTFDTRRRHAFGNDGTEERVHLLVDVLRKD